GLLYPFPDGFQVADRGYQVCQALPVLFGFYGIFQDALPDAGRMGKAFLQLQDLPGIYFSQRDLGHQPFDIAYLLQRLKGSLLYILVADKNMGPALALLYLPDIRKRENDPSFEHPGAHRRKRLVNGLEQGIAVFRIAADKLQVPYGELVHPQELRIGDPLY